MFVVVTASLSRSVQNKTADEIELPPEPQGKCPKALQVCQLDSGLLLL